MVGLVWKKNTIIIAERPPAIIKITTIFFIVKFWCVFSSGSAKQNKNPNIIAATLESIFIFE